MTNGSNTLSEHDYKLSQYEGTGPKEHLRKDIIEVRILMFILKFLSGTGQLIIKPLKLGVH
jgi:hypothetical protein